MTPRRRSTLALLAALAVASVVAALTARVSAAADGDLVIELPDAVKAAVKTEAGGDKIVELRRDNDGGNVGYLVVASGKGGEYLMRFDRDGVLTRKWVEATEGDQGEKAVNYEQLPKPVRDTLVDQLHGGTPKSITLREIKPTYEVRAQIGAKYYDIRLDTAGKLIEKVMSADQADAPQP